MKKLKILINKINLMKGKKELDYIKSLKNQIKPWL
jgi:hypothetical protein